MRNGDNKSLDTVRRGNEKVLRARLSDARFFYQEDQKSTLDEFSNKAEKVVFFPIQGFTASKDSTYKSTQHVHIGKTKSVLNTAKACPANC